MKNSKLNLILLFIIIFIINSCNKENGWDLKIKKIKKDEYYGIVKEKFIDTKNHNTPIVRLQPYKEISLYGEQHALIDKGDSLSKKLNTTIIEVYKNDTLIFINQEAYILFLKNKNK
jgi:hypothetical protein